MNIDEQIHRWEPNPSELVATIEDTIDGEGTIERIVKVRNVDGSELYGWYRYFSLGKDKIMVSVDHACIDADEVIHYLAERL